MGKPLILETTFLVDLERELARNSDGPAQGYLKSNADRELYITHTIAGELAAGASLDDRNKWDEFVRPFRILDCNKDVCWEYGKAYRYLKDNGLLIGNNDLWIAATALAHRMPVVTQNARHYRRVPGVVVEEYL
jgi:predicted nucleic acid-binding protein